MESDLTQSEAFYKLWSWTDKNKKQLLMGLAVAVVVGIGVAFWLAHQNETQNDANDALSKLTGRISATAPPVTPDALLKVASDYSSTDAGQRALLLAGGDLFAAGKYDEAQAQFQKFLQQYENSPLRAQAALGVAASYDAEGKTNDAVSAYQGVVARYQNQNVAGQANLALARLLEAQGNFKEARTALEDVTHFFPGTVGSEAAMLLRELNAAHPQQLEATNRTATVMTPAAAPMLGGKTN